MDAQLPGCPVLTLDDPSAAGQDGFHVPTLDIFEAPRS
jgi:hypothetical protein